MEIKYEFSNIIFNIKLCFKARIEATFSFCNHTGYYVEWVDFCSIAIPNDLVKMGGSGRVVIDTNEGMLIEDISLKEQFYPYKFRPMDYPSEGLYAMFPAVVQSQFLSYYDDTAGIYMATEDAKRNVKGIDFGPMDNAIKLQFKLYPGVTPADTEFDLGYNMVLDFFKGDWYDAFNRRTNATITVAEGFKGAYLCDLMENELEALEFTDNKVTIPVSNFEIVTLKFV